MLTMVYTPDGMAVSDFQLDFIVFELAKYIDKPGDNKLSYSTGNIFGAMRVEVAEGRISNTAIQFEFQYRVIKLDKYGLVFDWPNGFCDVNDGQNERILLAMVNQNKTQP